jgi:transcriptional regulator with XRE-family HTH domain
MEPREPFYVALGLRIRALREARDWSQEDLGSRLTPRVSRASIAYIETGRQRVLAHTLVALARIFDVDLPELLPEEKKEKEAERARKRVSAELRKKKVQLSDLDMKKVLGA